MAFRQKKVSPFTPQPRSWLSFPANMYVMESRSGETYNPHHSMSSPVFTMMVSSSATNDLPESIHELCAAGAASQNRDHAALFL